MERLSNTQGLTLLELMIVMVLSLLLMGAAYLAYEAQNKSSSIQHQIAQVQQDLRAAMDIITRDIRNAGAESPYAGTPILPIDASTIDKTGADKITLLMDIGDGLGGGPNKSTSEPGEHVFYHLDGRDLVRVDYNGDESRIIASNVQDFYLKYCSHDDATGTNNDIAPADLNGKESEIDYIDIRLVMRSQNPDPDTNQYITRTLDRRIKLRNSGK